MGETGPRFITIVLELGETSPLVARSVVTVLWVLEDAGPCATAAAPASASPRVRWPTLLEDCTWCDDVDPCKTPGWLQCAGCSGCV